MKKRNIMLCLVLVLSLAALVSGCKSTEPADAEGATPEPVEATAEPTQQPTAEVTAVPTATVVPITYTSQEIEAATKVVKDYCEEEKIKIDEIEVDDSYLVENEMRFVVFKKDSKESIEVLVSRTDANSEWAIKSTD